MAYYVYILRCKDNSLYTGITTRPFFRLQAHKNGKGAKYTRSHEALFFESLWVTSERSIALSLEAKIKRLSKKQKEDLIQTHNLVSLDEQSEFIYAGGKEYAQSLQAANEYLNKQKVQYIDMLEALQLGLARVVASGDDGVLIYLPLSQSYFLTAENPARLEAFCQLLSEEWFCIVTHHDYETAFVKERFSLHASENCYNVAYLKKKAPNQNAKVEIRPLEKSHAEIVKNTYRLYDAASEIDLLIDSKLMLGAFDGETLLGFAGFHAEGALGMLEVLPQYKQKGYGTALSIAMINMVLKQKRTPFAQIFASNIPSIKMQKNLGFSFSSPEITWLHKEE